MRAYGRRGRTAPALSISQSMTPDISFSQSENEESDNSNIEQTHSGVNTSPTPSGIKLRTTSYEIVGNPPIKTDTSVGDIGTTTISSDIAVQDDDFNSYFGAIELDPSSDINIHSQKYDMSPKRIIEKDKKALPELQAFDFLDMPKTVTKRRKTNYYKHVVYDLDVQQSEDANVIDDARRINPSMDKVLENVGKFLLTLEPKNDHSLEDMFNDEKNTSDKEDIYNTRVTKGQKVYNSRRTLLVKNGTSEDGEQSMVDEYLDEIEENLNKDTERNDTSVHVIRSIIPKGNDKTYTFNELKNIGNSLKYQEDYDYLTTTLQKNTPLSNTISILSELILAINGDDKFLLYILRHHSDEICKWCLQQDSTGNHELLLLQGYILNLFHKESDFFCDLENVQQMLLNLAKCTKESKGLRTNKKMQKLMYLDFLKVNGKNTGLDYALNIWNTYITKFSTEYMTRVLQLLIEMVDTEETRNIICNLSYFGLLQTLLGTLKGNGDEKDTIFRAKQEISKMLMNHPDLINNDEYLKCIVIITNDRKTVQAFQLKTAKSITDIILHSIIQHLKEQSKDNNNNAILQLGLCLNIINDSHTDLAIPDIMWRQLKQFVFQNDVHKVQIPIIQNLLYLNFAFLTIIKKTQTSNGASLLSDTEKVQMKKALEQFKFDTSNINKFVDEKVTYAISEVKNM